MSIKLDWEVQSEGGWDEIGEDPQALAARRRRARRLRNLLIGLLAVGLVVGGIAGYRLYATGQQSRAALTAVVTAETVALRLGDYDAFSAIQADLGTWRTTQSRAFDEYQDLAGRLEVTGEIVEMEIDADRARVVLAERLDGVDYRVLWFYGRGEDDIWRHTPPDTAAWGQQEELDTPHVIFHFDEEDRPLAETLLPLLTGWWEIACRQLACVEQPPRLTVRVEPDPLLGISVAAYDPATILIPSPLLSRYRADGTLDPALLDELARIMAGYWARRTLGDERDPSQTYQLADAVWLEAELALWLRQSFDDGGEPAPLLGPLAENYGREAVASLINRVIAGQEVPNAIEGITGSPSQDLPVGWEVYLTHRFRAEIALLRDPARSAEAALLYGDPGRPGPRVTVDYLVTLTADPDTIQIVSLRRFGELWWAEVRFGFPNPRGDETASRVVYEPFRLVDGRWAHSIAHLDDWGELRQEQGQNVTLHYFDLDTPAMDGLLAEAESIHATISAGLGVPPQDLPVIISFVIPESTDPSGGSGIVAPLPLTTEGIEVQVASPHAAIRDADMTLIDHTRWLTTYALALEMTGRVAGPHDHRPLGLALARQILIQQGLDPDAAVYPSPLNLISDSGDAVLDAALGPGAHRAPPESLESLWLPGPGFIAYGTRDYVAADVLLELLVQIYGPDALAALAPNLAHSASVEDWLYRSLGIHTSDIETQWRARTEYAVSAIP